jgi:hypothetical protein
VLCIFLFCLSSFYDVLCPILPLTLNFQFWLLLQLSLTFIRDSLERILEFSNVFFDIIQDSNNTLPINCFHQIKRHKTPHYRLKLFVSVSSGEISLLMATVCMNFCHIDENVCHIMFLEHSLNIENCWRFVFCGRKTVHFVKDWILKLHMCPCKQWYIFK